MFISTAKKLSTAFLVASLAGCATTRFTDGYNCTEVEQTKPIMIPLLAEIRPSDKITEIPECVEGKRAAAATLQDQPQKRTLGPMGYLFGKKFTEIHNGIIKTAPKSEEKTTSQLVLEFYNSMLKHFGDVSVSFFENPILPTKEKEVEKPKACSSDSLVYSCK
ncbi:MAG: hypothetical protein AUJ12_04715 [Alphaproteobacteria bacterium CG1_02_46_17]|nr:MAG: hypothetical protein AUJ12_04715 [Alphaproteobacteria bacterium CG1_02_46_17]